jgi:acetyl esterase
MKLDFGSLMRDGVGLLASKVLGADRANLERLFGKPPLNDRNVRLDHEAHVIAKLERLVHASPDDQKIAQRRKRMIELCRIIAGTEPLVADVRDLILPGGFPLKARLYRATLEPRPACVYFHGGGFVEGDLDSHDVLCRRLALESGCHILSVEYRKAPEHPFPSAVEDARRAFAWARTEASALGIDADRIGVGGDSAGGNLAANVGRLDRPAFQLLIYPALDMTRSSYSQRHFARGFVLDGETVDFFIDTYLGPADRRHPLASPVFAKDLAGAAPAHIVSAGFDPLRDEAERYADLLREAKVAVTLTCEESLLHGFANMTGLIAESRHAVSRIAMRLGELSKA